MPRIGRIQKQGDDDHGCGEYGSQQSTDGLGALLTPLVHEDFTEFLSTFRATGLTEAFASALAAIRLMTRFRIRTDSQRMITAVITMIRICSGAPCNVSHILFQSGTVPLCIRVAEDREADGLEWRRADVRAVSGAWVRVAADRESAVKAEFAGSHCNGAPTTLNTQQDLARIALRMRPHRPMRVPTRSPRSRSRDPPAKIMSTASRPVPVTGSASRASAGSASSASMRCSSFLMNRETVEINLVVTTASIPLIVVLVGIFLLGGHW